MPIDNFRVWERLPCSFDDLQSMRLCVRAVQKNVVDRSARLFLKFHIAFTHLLLLLLLLFFMMVLF